MKRAIKRAASYILVICCFMLITSYAMADQGKKTERGTITVQTGDNMFNGQDVTVTVPGGNSYNGQGKGHHISFDTGENDNTLNTGDVIIVTGTDSNGNKINQSYEIGEKEGNQNTEHDKGHNNYNGSLITPPVPSAEPTPAPSVEPEPSSEPSLEPSPEPSVKPTSTPIPSEEPEVTPRPSIEPTPAPTPSEEPEITPEPSLEPSPTPVVSEEPSASEPPAPTPTDTPTESPNPTSIPKDPGVTDPLEFYRHPHNPYGPPKTGDLVVIWEIILGLSIVGIIIISVLLIRNKK